MEDTTLKGKLLALTALAADYCRTLEEARNFERDEFISRMIRLLPRLYLGFIEIPQENIVSLGEEEYFESYVDEDYYESIRRGIEEVLGPDDTFLETFEEDMKYSDTPIASSISECLADIFQPLFNFISIVRDSEGESAEGAFLECRENFEGYWSQTLCNVLRAINYIRPHSITDFHND